MKRHERLAALVVGLLLLGLPASAPWLWPALARSPHPLLARGVLALGAATWVWLAVALVSEMRRQRVGERRRGNGIGWLAAALTASLCLMTPITTSSRHLPPLVHTMRVGDVSSALPLALAAKRRHDQLVQERRALDDENSDAFLAELEGRNDDLLEMLADRLPATLDGVAVVDLDRDAPTGVEGPVVVLPLDEKGTRYQLAFARPGGVLPLRDDGTLATRLVVLRGGPVVWSSSAAGTLRALATRARFDSVVVHASNEDLDPDLAARCVRLTDVVTTNDDTVDEPVVTVSLLRASPEISGLSAAPPTDLRLRATEVIAYLALHAGEPVSGERLRERVLGRGRGDATPRALTNVISVVRRSLGRDAKGPLLHAVTPGGAYETHGVTCDVTVFRDLVAQARASEGATQAALVRQALSLVISEPLSAVTRAWDWFLVEGHLGRVARDGEWAALCLADFATRQGNVELAWWALEQGRHCDPYSDVLVGALARVPRLSQFGGDGPHGLQDEAVGPRRGVGVTG